MKFFICGCNGMAGHTISLYLQEQGHEVYGFDLQESKLIKSFAGNAFDTETIGRVIKEGNYDTSFIEVNQERLRPRPGFKNDSEDMAIIASYIDYLMNYEENTDSTQDTSSALNRWRAFGLQKGVLRV